MKALVTGGAGFIGRWVVKALLDDGHSVFVVDDLSNGLASNLSEFEGHPRFEGLIPGSVTDPSVLSDAFSRGLDRCFHLAAKVVVQDSIDDPETTFINDVQGTFRLLEQCRRRQVPLAFVSSCMVYDQAPANQAIDERHTVRPASPYAACKLSAEQLVLAYHQAYGLQGVVIRPFNTYGPFQKSTGEGGVVSVFLRRELEGRTLDIYGDGTQTRDLLYVEDCARLIVGAALCENAQGRVVNGGTGHDVTINELARCICSDVSRIRHVPHIHPRSEIQKLRCDSTLAERLFGWKPTVDLSHGIERTRRWIAEQGSQPSDAPRALLPYGRQWITEDDVAAVGAVLRSDWLTQGPWGPRFERAVAEYCGARYAVGLSSGTAALHAAYHAAGIGPGHEVVTTPITFAATANAVLFCGATPRFVDIDAENLCVDPEAVARAICPSTRAVAPVDFAGHPCDYDRLRDLTRQHGVLLIADSCHALGARYKGKKLGALADMTVLSFHPVKHITTGEGGMVLTDREDLYEVLRDFRVHGMTRDPRKLARNPGPWYYEMVDLGYNYRLSDIQSALGWSQLKRLDAFIERRRQIARRYGELLADVPCVAVPREADWAASSYHLFVIQVDFAAAGIDRREVFDRMREAGVGLQVHYIPVHLHPYYRKLLGTNPGDFPVAEAYYERAVSLPMFPRLGDTDVERVVRELKRVLTSRPS